MQLTGIAHQIWDEKYRYKSNTGEPIDLTVDDTFARIAKALTANELPSDRDKHEAEFLEVLSDFSVLPAGRIIAGAGTRRNVTLLNCFHSPRIPDSLDGIYDVLKWGGLTMKEGGGLGTDFSTLRPRGALIESLGSTSSGPLSFMDQWDSMCRSIMSAGHRRGAMMGTLRIDHPSVEEFIDAKRDGKCLRMFNLSVLITDAFMDCVKNNGDWDLVFGGRVYKTVQARDLWDQIMRSTYGYADPGVIFIDRINAANPLRYAEELIGTNPCSEKPLPEWGTCCLGSVNLTRMVIDPFQPSAQVDWNHLVHSVGVLVRMLDNVIDVTRYPLPQQHEEMMRKRRIGIGVTGLADMFAMLGVAYNSDKAVQMASNITSKVHMVADKTTQQLGEERGSFPLYDPEKYNRCGTLTDHAKYRRNSHLTSIAPTGTISLFAGNISSGIEPIFDLILKRRILQKDDSWQEVEVKDYAWGLREQLRLSGEIGPSDGSSHWVTVANLRPSDHLNILAACQRNVDSSISKTINCPESISFEEFKDIYLEAYRLGVKSCTTYRPNKVTGSILSSDSMAVKSDSMSNVVELTKPLVRPERLLGSTYRIKPPGVEHALFITINDIEDTRGRRPFEVFINTKNLEFVAWTTALTRMVSAVFRKGGDVAFVTDELKAVFDPRGGGYWEDKTYVPSLIAGIGMVIERHLQQLGVHTEPKAQVAKHCPKCQHGSLLNKEGCWSCDSCTYSSCG